MDIARILAEIDRYEKDLVGILSRFTHTSQSLSIARNDDPVFRQYVHELVDLFHDALGRNGYSQRIMAEFTQGVSNYLGTPSYKCVENILSIVRAARTRFVRSPDIFGGVSVSAGRRVRENVFIIHGHDEAKWRELKDILLSFKLHPIVLMEQPNAGCTTIIEKFEYYAPICSFAIAIFTPDDEITSTSEPYFQGRPNVIYELGWFCGTLGRKHVMLLLRQGTSLFSDFSGVIQKRFSQNISEKAAEIRNDLVFAGILDDDIEAQG